MTNKEMIKMTEKELRANHKFATRINDKKTNEFKGYTFNYINWTYGIWFTDNTAIVGLTPKEYREILKGYEAEPHFTFFA